MKTVNKKGELAAVLVLTVIFVAAFSAMYFIDPKTSSNQVTGAAVAGSIAGASLNSCGNVNESSVLTQNINSNGTCFNITASNIVLDCAGYTITGNGTGASSGYGIYAQTKKNITVQNCNLTNFYYGMYLDRANNSLILNNYFDSNYKGAYFWVGFTHSAPGYTVRNNTFSSHTDTALTIGQMQHNLIEGNTFYYSSSSEIYLSGAQNTTVLDNDFYGSTNTWASVRLQSSVPEVSIVNNTMSCGKYCVYAQNNYGFVIEGNTMTKNSAPVQTTGAIYYDAVNHTVARDNTFLGSSSYRDISYEDTYNNTIVDSTVNRYVFLNADLQSLEDTDYGKILFLDNFSESTAFTAFGLFGGSNSDIQIENNSVFVNSSREPGFNVSAEITVYNINTVNPDPFVDLEDDGQFVPCAFCTELSYNQSTQTYIFNTTHFTAFKVGNDTSPPTSNITTLTNNSDIGKNSFPVNISGTASDDFGLSYVQVSINGTLYNATGLTSWNYSWTPAQDGLYQIYSMAVDTSNNTETQLETYSLEIYTTSNLTNATKTNSYNLNSDIFDSVETNSTINISYINRSEFINLTPSYNCTITLSNLNDSRCYHSTIYDCDGENWYVNPSIIINVIGSNNNFSNSNVSNSFVDDSNVSDSEVSSSNITSSSIVNGSDIVNSNITNSRVEFSNVTDGEVEDSFVLNSNVSASVVNNSNATNSNVLNDSIITNSNVTDSEVISSNVTDSFVNDSNINDSDVQNSTLISTTVTNSTVTGSTLNNVTVNNSNVNNLELNNTIIVNDQCSSGTIVYQGTTYNCPISLSNVYNPPTPPSGGGGGGGTRRYECNDGIDNDGDGDIDYPSDLGCTSSFDDDESETTCQQLWVCSDWSDCINNLQARTCYDENECQRLLNLEAVERIAEVEKPVEEKSCTPASCSDNIQNQGETGIDCGGPCEPCPSAGPECTANADCPENYECANNQCTAIVPERQPTPTVGQRLSDALSKTNEIFSGLLDYNKKINQQIEEWLRQLLNELKDLALAAFNLAKTAASKTSDFIKFNYGPVIITVLVIAVVIAGYFAYRSFLHSPTFETIQSKQTLIQKKKQQFQKAKQQKQIEKASQQLTEFIRASLLSGQTLAQTKKALITHGWPKKIVEQYTQKIYDAFKPQIKETRKLKQFRKEDLALEQSIKKPLLGIKLFERPKIKLPKPEILETPREKLRKRILELIQKDKNKKEIISTLKKENWDQNVVRQYLKENYPQLENISYFKKEVEDLEKTLEKLKQGDKK